MIPMHDRILVRKLPVAERMIVLVRLGDESTVDDRGGDYRRNIVRAEVVAVGPGNYDGNNLHVPVDVRPGQVVYCTEWDDSAGYFGPEHLLIREQDIALVEDGR